MSLADWLRVFRTLHEKAKKGELSGADADDYRAGCDELARALMAAQKAAARPGEPPRQALRVARAVQVTVEGPTFVARATTIELSAGGFSALLAKAPPAGEELRATLKLPGGEPVAGDVAAAEVKTQAGSARVAFAWKALAAADRDRLTLLVIDSALSQLAA